MAEALFRDYVAKEGWEDKVIIDSAATGPWHVGKPPHPGTLAKLEEVGVSSEGLIGREISKADMEEFDYVIGMDNSNLENIAKLGAGTKNVYRMLDFSERFRGLEVPDPYFTGDFQETYELLCEACSGLLEEIRRKLS